MTANEIAETSWRLPCYCGDEPACDDDGACDRYAQGGLLPAGFTIAINGGCMPDQAATQ